MNPLTPEEILGFVLGLIILVGLAYLLLRAVTGLMVDSVGNDYDRRRSAALREIRDYLNLHPPIGDRWFYNWTDKRGDNWIFSLEDIYK